MRLNDERTKFHQIVWLVLNCIIHKIKNYYENVSHETIIFLNSSPDVKDNKAWWVLDKCKINLVNIKFVSTKLHNSLCYQKRICEDLHSCHMCCLTNKFRKNGFNFDHLLPLSMEEFIVCNRT